jgi:hypothetical protein
MIYFIKKSRGHWPGHWLDSGGGGSLGEKPSSRSWAQVCRLWHCGGQRRAALAERLSPTMSGDEKPPQREGWEAGLRSVCETPDQDAGAGRKRNVERQLAAERDRRKAMRSKLQVRKPLAPRFFDMAPASGVTSAEGYVLCRRDADSFAIGLPAQEALGP